MQGTRGWRQETREEPSRSRSERQGKQGIKARQARVNYKGKRRDNHASDQKKRIRKEQYTPKSKGGAQATMSEGYNKEAKQKPR